MVQSRNRSNPFETAILSRARRERSFKPPQIFLPPPPAFLYPVGKSLEGAVMGRRIKFGPFELDRQTGELWKHGLKDKLQGKHFQIIVALLEQLGESVSRETLPQRH